MGVPKAEEREEGAEDLLKEIIAENFLNLKKKLDIQVHEPKRILNYLHAKRPSLRHYNKTLIFTINRQIVLNPSIPFHIFLLI